MTATTVPDLRSVAEPTDGRLECAVVVTYGRSGSTLAQGLLNALPRTVCRGENGMYPLHLFRAAEHAVTFAEKHLVGHPGWKRLARKSHSAFYGAHLLRMDRFVASSRELMTDLLVGNLQRDGLDRIGFKEVRWHELRPRETEAFFDWFDACFPGTRYVLNTRDVADVMTSGFWRRRPQDRAERHIERVMQVQQLLRETRPDRVYDLRYEEVTSTDAAAAERQLRGLAEFVLGSCSEEVLSSLRATLEVGHGPYPFGRSKAAASGGGDDGPGGAG